jgi:spore maturation protein CgeB
VRGGPLDIVVLGLSLTSSWGNGHATTYRALLRALAERGHRLLFLERDVPWYARARDLPAPPFCELALYGDRDDLADRFSQRVRDADLVMLGSFVPEGRAVAEWILGTAHGATAFYDIDTPVTLASLHTDECAYLSRRQIPAFDLYLSFTGGPTLRRLERVFGAQRARPLYCSFDPDQYFPEAVEARWELGYMGTYSADRQRPLDALLLAAAVYDPSSRFVVAGALYPSDLEWPRNVERIEHLAPAEHRAFYGSQRWTLNLTRADMKAAGYSPSVRLFEAAACGVPVLSDDWTGIEEFFLPGEEILIVRSTADVVRALGRMSPAEAHRMGRRARRRALGSHTARHRADTFEKHVLQVLARRSRATRSAAGATAARAGASRASAR